MTVVIPKQQSQQRPTQAQPPKKTVKAVMTKDIKTLTLERVFRKIKRWLEKLNSVEDPVLAFRLNVPEELGRVSGKYTEMLCYMRDAIEQEWIEEELVVADGTAGNGNTEQGVPNGNVANGASIVAKEFVDLTMNSDEIAAANGGGNEQPQRDENKDQSKNTSTPDEKVRLMQFPVALIGKQRGLDELFTISELPPLEGGEPVLDENGEVARDVSIFRRCKNCKSTIWNRGWTCGEYLSRESCPASGHHICNGCFAEGHVCNTSHGMIMTQRFTVGELIAAYHDAVSAFNKFFMPCRPPSSSLTEFTVDATGILDEYLLSDPRPADGRSAASVTYHLNLRFLHRYPDVSCHQCKSRRPPYEIITCSNNEHIASMGTHPSEAPRSRAGFYYCTRCVAFRYKQSPLECFKQRDWHCYVCSKECDCSTCKQTTLEKQVLALPNGTALRKRRRNAESGVEDEGSPAVEEEANVSANVSDDVGGRRTSRQRKSKIEGVEDSKAPVVQASVAATRDVQQQQQPQPQLQKLLPKVQASAPPPPPLGQPQQVNPSFVGVHPQIPTQQQQQQHHQHMAQQRQLSQPTLQQQHAMYQQQFQMQGQQMNQQPIAMRPQPPPQQQQNYMPITGMDASSIDVAMLNMPIGKMLYDLQKKYQIEAEARQKLAVECESLRKLAIAGTSYEELMQENLQLKLNLQSAEDNARKLQARNQELEKLHAQTSSVVIPNLRKIAKALNIQTLALAKSLPNDPPEMALLHLQGSASVNGTDGNVTPAEHQ